MADIELVIKIPENYYKDLMSLKLKDGEHLSYEMEMIKNGTPLPKGHGRLKDVDWIDDNCESHHSDKDGSCCYAWRDIDNAPTIIEADKENKE